MLNPEEKLALIKYIYGAIYPNVSSFFGTDYVGADLAYIVAAIVHDQVCELDALSVVVRLLRTEFEPDSILWNYLHVEPTVMCMVCEKEVLLNSVSYSNTINGWMCRSCRF